MNEDVSMLEPSVSLAVQGLPDQHEVESSFSYRAMDKCSNCRRRKKACRPFGRSWPEDGPCEGCLKAKLPCGPNTRQLRGIEGVGPPAHEMDMTESTTARVVTNAQWNQIKPSFEKSYIDEKKPLKDVMKIMQRDHDFRASRRQYHGQIEKWGLQKYNKKPSASRNGTPSSTGTPSLDYAQLSISSFEEPSNIIRMRPPERPGVLSGARQVLGSFSGIGRSPLQQVSSPGHDHFVLAEPGATAYISNPSKRLDNNELRLVRLAPGLPSDPVSIELHSTDLGQADDYVAVSYVWENGKDTEVIESNGHICRIGADVENCLRCFRHESMDRWLWIDAVCANQEDLEEKSKQAQMMPDIYANANGLLVWLGADTAKSTYAIKFINAVLSMNPFESVLRFPESMSMWEAFSDMLILPWFRRAFSLQEVSFAQQCTLFWGNSSILWSDFADAFDMVNSMEASMQRLDLSWSEGFFHQIHVSSVMQLVSTSRLITAASRNIQHGESRPALETLLVKSRSLQTTDPRDRIYALFGLFSDEWTSEEPPKHPTSMVFAEVPFFDTPSSTGTAPGRLNVTFVDYHKDILTLCVEVMEFVIRQSNSLDIICRPWAPQVPGLPSWISTLGRDSFKMAKSGLYTRVNADVLVGAPDLMQQPYKASTQDCIAGRRLGQILDTNILKVQGFPISKITSISSVAIEGIIPTDWLALAQWLNLDTPPPAPFWLTLVANRDSAGQKPPPWFARVCHWIFNQPPPGEPLNTNEMLRMPKCPPYVAIFLRRMQAVVWKRRLFVTDGGHIGMGPEHIQVGDSVNILAQCSVPIVLRQLDEMNHYGVVGDCYLDGMMDGEACRGEPRYMDYFLR